MKIKRLLKLVDTSNKILWKTVLLCVLGAGFHVLNSLLLVPLIDSTLYSEEHLDINILILFIASVIISAIFRYLVNLHFALWANENELLLNDKMAAYLTSIELIDLDNKQTGEYLNLHNKRVKSLYSFFRDGLKTMFYQPLEFIFVFIAVLTIDFNTGIIIIPAIILSSVLDIVLSRKIKKSSKASVNIDDKVRALQKEVVESIDSIKINKAVKYFDEKHITELDEQYKTENELSKDMNVAYIPALINEYMPSIILVVIVLVRAKIQPIDYGEFLALFSLIFGVSLPFAQYLRSLNKLERLSPIITEFEEICLKQTTASSNAVRDFQNIKQSENDAVIRISNLTYAYQNNIEVINNLSLSVREHEKIAILGISGVGKSTLVKIMLGLLKPHSGQVSLFGVNSYDNNEFVQSKLAYIEADNMLFNESIKYNITLLDRELTEDECKKYQNICEILSLFEIIKEHEIIHQFGRNLSGGQRLKLALARALFTEAELFIFDEPTAAFDSGTEDIFGEILSKLSVTSVVITHRTKLLHLFDNVYSMENGKLVLVRKNEIY